MKNLLKKYFLFIAQSPIFWALVIALAFFCLYFAGLIVTTFFLDKSTFEFMRVGMNLTIFLVFSLSIINMLAPKLMITLFDISKQKIILIYRAGKPEIYQKPLLEKCRYKIFDLPHQWFLPLSGGDETSLIIDFKVPINDKTLLIPLKLKFHFYGEIKARDLETLLALQNEKTQAKTIIQFEECIEYVFEENNLTPEKKEKIRKIIEDCTNEKKPLIQLIIKIKEEIFFPGHIFPNAEIKIKLISFKAFWE